MTTTTTTQNNDNSDRLSTETNNIVMILANSKIDESILTSTHHRPINNTVFYGGRMGEQKRLTERCKNGMQYFPKVSESQEMISLQSLRT